MPKLSSSLIFGMLQVRLLSYIILYNKQYRTTCERTIARNIEIVLCKSKGSLNSTCVKCSKCHAQILKISLGYCHFVVKGLSLLQKIRVIALENLDLGSIQVLIFFAACSKFSVIWTSSSGTSIK